MMVIIVQVVQNTSNLHGSIQVLQIVDHVKCPKGSDDQLYVLHYIAACRWHPEENIATHILCRAVSALKKYDPEHHDATAYTYSRNVQYCAAKKKEGIVVESLGYVIELSRPSIPQSKHS
jgi:hypothetical protein